MKKVGVVMGSDSDLPVVEKAINCLKNYGVPVEVRVLSAHRTPKEAALEILNGMPEEKLLKKDRLGPVLLILFLIAGGLSLFWAVQVRSHFPASVAVIGGADGPTSIFVAGKLGHAWGLYAAAVLLLLALTVHLWRRSRM